MEALSSFGLTSPLRCHPHHCHHCRDLFPYPSLRLEKKNWNDSHKINFHQLLNYNFTLYTKKMENKNKCNYKLCFIC